MVYRYANLNDELWYEYQYLIAIEIELTANNERIDNWY